MGLVGAAHFVRSNPKSDRFGVRDFAHVEVWCGDASTTWRRWAHGLGLQLVAKSDHSTGNSTYASYVCRSHDLTFVFTAPYATPQTGTDTQKSPVPHPGYDQTHARQFQAAHGTAVRAVALLVDDAAEAHKAAVSAGAVSVLPPCTLDDGATVLAEVVLYADVVLRFVSAPDSGFVHTHGALPGYEAVHLTGSGPARSYGLFRLDHCVGNVPQLVPAMEYVQRVTGFHEFAEFVSEDVGTVDSGLNSVVLASNNERVLLPMNEPTHGTRRRSQIQTYLEQHGGPGVQHLALATNDIFATLQAMAAAAGPDGAGGFELIRSAGDAYYDALPARVGADRLSPEQFAKCRSLGILVDRDDQGILLQVFTRPVGDRPTLFLEIIQRVGCHLDKNKATAWGEPYAQAAGCGGFGKGNFTELFKSIEDYEATLKL